MAPAVATGARTPPVNSGGVFFLEKKGPCVRLICGKGEGEHRLLARKE